jgi:hypothetical protein
MEIHSRCCALLLAAALPGCESAMPRLDASFPGYRSLCPAEIELLARGRTETIAKCSGCHPLYRPSRGDAAYWELWLGKMADRSRLRPEERERIRAYLVAASRSGPSAAADAPPAALRAAPANGSER